jgi:branched-chain amino acid transport system permease protein
MSTNVLLLLTGIGLGAIYFLVASGLSLIYGLMHVLNFAHGVFLSLGAFLGFEIANRIGAATWTSFAVSLLVGGLAGAIFAALTERFLVQRLYERHIEQVLITVGLALAAVALFEGIWGTDPRFISSPAWMDRTTTILGAQVPNDVFVAIVVAVLVLVGMVLFLHRTRYGMIIRAGVENRAMVTALGIDVRTAFTLVFTIGGFAAGLGGVLASHYFGYVSPLLGQTLLIFAFIVTVIGGLGSLTGAAVASVLVALLQQFANYHLRGTGDVAVVILLAVVLLTRPSGLMGRKVA